MPDFLTPAMTIGDFQDRLIAAQDLAQRVRGTGQTGPVRGVWHGTNEEFDAFDASCCLGTHFGSAAAAHARLSDTKQAGGEVRAFDLAIENPLDLPDLGTWGFQSVARELRAAEVATPEQIDKAYEAFNTSDAQGWAALKAIIRDAGFDGVRYINAVEDAGSLSWIALDGDQVLRHEDHDSPHAADVPSP